MLAKHDAIASGSPLPSLVANSSPQPTASSPQPQASSPKPNVVVSSSPKPNAIQHDLAITRAPVDEEDEEEDEFAQLARRLFLTLNFLYYFHSFVAMVLIIVVLKPMYIAFASIVPRTHDNARTLLQSDNHYL